MRSSGRLRARHHSDPLAVLDEDSLRLVLDPLPPTVLQALHGTSKAWRQHVRQHVRTARWREAYGCVYPRSLCQILSESGVARLDVGGCRGGCVIGPSRLVFRRLDGPSLGPISSRHVVGLFAAHEEEATGPPTTHSAAEHGGRTKRVAREAAAAPSVRLDLVCQPGGPQLAGYESVGTQVRIRPLRNTGDGAEVAAACGRSPSEGKRKARCPPNGGGSSSSHGNAHNAGRGEDEGPLCYEEIFGVFDREGRVRLVVSTQAVPERWSNRLRLVPLSADGQPR